MPEDTALPEIIAGVILCLFGWTLYWIGLHAAGGAIGGMIGALSGLGVAVLADESGRWGLPLMAAGGLVGAVIGFIWVRRVHALAFFVLGVAAGASVAAMTIGSVIAHAPFMSTWPPAPYVYYGVCAVALGALMALFSNYLIVISTALIGSLLIVMGFGPERAGVAFIPILLLSLIVQTFLFRRVGAKDGGDGGPPEGQKDGGS